MLGQIPALTRYIKENKIDIIHAHLPWAGLVAGLAGKRAGIPVFYTEHNNFTRYHWLTRMTSKYSYRNYDRVFMVSGDAHDAANAYFPKGFPCKVDTLLNGINTDHFKPDPGLRVQMRTDWGWGEEHIVIGLVAVYRVQKRIDRWLEIARMLHQRFPAARFLLVGTGPLQAQVNQCIYDSGLQEVVVQTGLQTDVRPYYAAMDLFHMSSDFEGLPIALLEAMSMAVAPVVSRTGGMPEVVDASCGYIYNKEDLQDAAEGLGQLINDKDLLKQKQRAARNKMIGQFDLRRMVTQLETAYSF